MFKNAIKRILSTAIAIILLVVFSAHFPATKAGFDNFTLSGKYRPGQFRDVNEIQWFSRYVEDAYNFGFFRGKTDECFDHAGLLTLGEAVTIAARLNKIYYTGSAVFKESVPYYSVYADYVLSRGIIDSHLDYDTSATRAVFAQIVYKALPAEALPVINTIADYGICDVMPDAGYGSAVYALYRAGILTGSDRYGTFFPDSNITRAEACAIMVRLADKATRITTKLPVKIPAEDIFLRCTDAVFTLETFDSDGDSIRTGSGFFISDTGLAVTALHVFENAASATVTLVSGSIYPVLGLYDTDEKYNLALFPIDAGDAVFHYLNLADSDLVEAGNTVYALGNPRNLVNTITDGIISNVGRIVDEDVFIQFTAPISFGSGGGPILNTLCQVVGVTSISFSHGQNLNFAIPVNYIKELQPGELVTLDKFLFNDA